MKAETTSRLLLFLLLTCFRIGSCLSIDIRLSFAQAHFRHSRSVSKEHSFQLLSTAPSLTLHSCCCCSQQLPNLAHLASFSAKLLAQQCFQSSSYPHFCHSDFFSSAKSASHMSLMLVSCTFLYSAFCSSICFLSSSIFSLVTW